MRPVHHGDVVAAACALRAVPMAQRARRLEQMLARADVAERYCRAHDRLHPRWGNGSLMAVARAQTRPSEPPLSDRDYCRCLALVFARLGAGRAPACPAR